MTESPDKVVVIKMNTQHEETWRYEGRILARNDHSILVEAFFNRSDLPFHGITLRENDRFLERYYEDRWYNIFEIHDRNDDRVKGWYCNVTAPAEFAPGKIIYMDLALDVLVYPDGTYLVLDKAEFEDLALNPESRTKALQALDILVKMAESDSLTKALK
jgi:hypothetical protein